MKEAEIPGRCAKTRQSSYQPFPHSLLPPSSFPPPELLSKPGPSARSMTGLSEDKDEDQSATWHHSEPFLTSELANIFMLDTIP